MLALKHFRDRIKGLSDLLNFAALVDDGIVLCKDGTLLAGWFYRGPDTASSSPAELNYLTARLNAAFARLGTGYAIWIDAVRLAAASYPEPHSSYFPDPVSRAIDEERRTQFMAEAAHFETEYVLILGFQPPLQRQSRIADLVYDDDPAHEPQSPGDKHIASFKRVLNELEDGLSSLLKLRRMQGYRSQSVNGAYYWRDELLSYLHFCVTGLLHPINVPRCAMYLDSLIGGQELWGGDTPKIGGQFITTLSIDGFPHDSFPNCLASLENLALPFRFSTRWIPLDAHESVGELNRYRRKWGQWKRGFWAQVFKMEGGVVNEDAALMASQTERAITDASSALVTFGYYTPTIILMNEDRTALEAQAREIARELRRDGFTVRVETINTMEAWLGSIPGHVHPNVRRPLIHSLNLADLIPSASTWPGRTHNPSPLFPPYSPPLLFGATTGSTPFRLNLHVSDVGHTLVFGPTGAGKSTLLALIAAQFCRYPNATITVFDKGRSLLALAHAVGGAHYELVGGETQIGLCPLTQLESDADRIFAEEWIATCYELQSGKAPTPRQREDIHRAISLLSNDTCGRSLTDFVTTVQDADIRAALSHYTISGALGVLLDARHDGIAESCFKVFEIEDLMGLGEKNLIPVLLYLFRQFERSLTGEPALLLLDEAWVMLGHPVFREKIREWLKVLRKANCAVILATQSLSDAVRSGLLDVLLEACPTKILLPNEEADKGGTGQVLGPSDLYALFGLNETEIGLLKSSLKKRHYYYTSPDGKRLFELGLGPLALAFAGVSSREDVARVRELIAIHGADWVNAWLTEKGLPPISMQEDYYAV